MRAIWLGAVALLVVAIASCSRAPSGAIAVSNAWASATPPGASTGAGYLTISNGTAKAVRLTGGSSAAAENVELHEMSMDGDVMRMRPLPDGIEIPSGGSVEFGPGGKHLMLVGLKAPLVEGATVPVTLTFDGASPIEVLLSVKAPGGHGH